MKDAERLIRGKFQFILHNFRRMQTNNTKKNREHQHTSTKRNEKENYISKIDADGNSNS